MLVISNNVRAQQKGDSTAQLSLHFQQTAIMQNHGNFASPYAGSNSFVLNEKAALTITSTLFIHASLGSWIDLELDP